MFPRAARRSIMISKEVLGDGDHFSSLVRSERREIKNRSVVESVREASAFIAAIAEEVDSIRDPGDQKISEILGQIESKADQVTAIHGQFPAKREKIRGTAFEKCRGKFMKKCLIDDTGDPEDIVTGDRGRSGGRADLIQK